VLTKGIVAEEDVLSGHIGEHGVRQCSMGASTKISFDSPISRVSPVFTVTIFQSWWK